jgi:DNA-binding NarL/FixJ family response regulator
MTAALSAALPDAQTSIVKLDIAMLNTLAPDALVIDVDDLAIDPLEALRQLRFVVPVCAIIVYTNSAKPMFARDCHNAGANCLLSKSSSVEQMASGIRYAMQSGCFTDPRFSRTA